MFDMKTEAIWWDDELNDIQICLSSRQHCSWNNKRRMSFIICETSSKEYRDFLDLFIITHLFHARLVSSTSHYGFHAHWMSFRLQTDIFLNLLEKCCWQPDQLCLSGECKDLMAALGWRIRKNGIVKVMPVFVWLKFLILICHKSLCHLVAVWGMRLLFGIR